jgi:molybdopterin-guanine dinucleotide biosynthesis protein A
MKPFEICGIILAGGESKRMGSDKTILNFRGKSLVERMAGIISPFCKKILISSNSQHHIGIGYKVVPDEISGRGPIIGIYSSLRKSDSIYNMVLPADLPLISAELVRFLLNHAKQEKISAIVTPEGYIEPLCAMYPKTILPALEDFIQSGNNKLIDFLKANRFHPIQLSEKQSFYHPKLLLNVNTPEEFDKLISEERNLSEI